MRCVILRGCPGAGKSTYVKKHYPEAVVCSADTYFTGPDGVYRFDAARLREAHAVCLRSYVEALQRKEALVVVDNTNITVAEVAPYAALAMAYGYDLRIVTLLCDLVVAANRNIHGVPFPVVERMFHRLMGEGRLFPAYWPHTTVTSPA